MSLADMFAVICRCASQDALQRDEKSALSPPRQEISGEKGEPVGASHDKAAVGGNHDASFDAVDGILIFLLLVASFRRGTVHLHEEALWNSGRAFDPGSVVVRRIAVGRALLNPVTYRKNSLIVNVTAHSTGGELESLTFLAATVADVTRRWRLVRHSGVAEGGSSGGVVVVVTGRGSVRSVRIAVDRRSAGRDSSGLVQMQPQNTGELTWPSALVFVATACWSRQTWLPSPTLRRWEQRQEFEQTV